MADAFVEHRLASEHHWALWSGDLTYLERWPDVSEEGVRAQLETLEDFARRADSIEASSSADRTISLAISPETFEGIVLSHGHFDHVMGLEGLARRLGARNLPVMIHPEFWTRRRVVSPSGEWELPVSSRARMEDSGLSIMDDRQPSILFEGALLITGEVDRTTGFEQGMSIHQAWREDGWQPDPLILDDQALPLEVAGKGLVVLTGCGHSGNINIIKYAKRLPASTASMP